MKILRFSAFQACLIAFASLAILTTIGSPAHARRGGASIHTEENLTFVEETGIPSANGDYSLCVLVKQKSVFGVVNVFAQKKHVLAVNKCDTDQYVSLTEEQFSKISSDGVISSALAFAPNRTLQDYFQTSWGILLFIFIIATAIIIERRKKAAAAKRGPQALSPGHLIVHALVGAANADGHVAKQEVATIAAIMQKISSKKISLRKTKKIIRSVPRNVDFGVFRATAPSLSAAEKHAVISAVLMVVGADGAIDEREQNYVHDLCQSLGISPEEFQNIQTNLTKTNAAA